MTTPHDEQIERFRKRTERVDDALLRRNLRAGVYGPPGSTRRAVAERAIELRSSERVEAVQLATERERTDLEAAVARAAARARLAVWLAVLALLAALVALARLYASA